MFVYHVWNTFRTCLGNVSAIPKVCVWATFQSCSKIIPKHISNTCNVNVWNMSQHIYNMSKICLEYECQDCKQTDAKNICPAAVENITEWDLQKNEDQNSKKDSCSFDWMQVCSSTKMWFCKIIWRKNKFRPSTLQFPMWPGTANIQTNSHFIGVQN